MASNNDGVWGDLRSITFVVKAAPWAELVGICPICVFVCVGIISLL